MLLNLVFMTSLMSIAAQAQQPPAGTPATPPQTPPSTPTTPPKTAPTENPNANTQQSATLNYAVGVWFDCTGLRIDVKTSGTSMLSSVSIVGLLDGRDVAYYKATDGTTLEIHNRSGGSKTQKAMCIYSFREPPNYLMINCLNETIPLERQRCEAKKREEQLKNVSKDGLSGLELVRGTLGTALSASAKADLLGKLTPVQNAAPSLTLPRAPLAR